LFAENEIFYWDIIGCTIHLMTRFVVHQGFTQALTGHRRFAHHQIWFEVSMGFGIIAGIRYIGYIGVLPLRFFPRCSREIQGLGLWDLGFNGFRAQLLRNLGFTKHKAIHVLFFIHPKWVQMGVGC